MTEQEYIFKHASEISDQKSLTVRRLQSEYVKRIWLDLVNALKIRIVRMPRPTVRDQHHQTEFSQTQ